MSLSNEEKIKPVIEHIKTTNQSLIDEGNKMNTYANYIKDDINRMEKQIDKLKSNMKYSIYLKEGEKFVSVIFKDEKNVTICSVFCKNTDKFMLAYNKLRNKYEQIKENEYNLYFNKKLIDLNKTFDENGLKNGDKINLIKKNVI